MNYGRLRLIINMKCGSEASDATSHLDLPHMRFRLNVPLEELAPARVYSCGSAIVKALTGEDWRWQFGNPVNTEILSGGRIDAEEEPRTTTSVERLS